MQQRFSDIKNCKLFTTDGVIGKVTDLLVEDDEWIVRYLVVDIQSPISSRRILIAPAAIEGVNIENNMIATILSAQQVMQSPLLDDDQPACRRYEEALVEYYGWPVYWLGRAVLPARSMDKLANDEATSFVDENGSTNLRSAKEICGYRIKSGDDSVGSIQDLVVKMNSWIVSFAMADPRTWSQDQPSMFSTSQIESVHWSNREVVVKLAKDVRLPNAPTSNGSANMISSQSMPTMQHTSPDRS
ncbi:PRC-barrel domain-containing protein [Mariniblastus fucicola]|uniref:PRC-barrel domain protein n=1 Tax=Mariniblastus fucicola TaxID=980251 RepID=A0A5B9PHC9_9BACT|nr:PRC-barrel domain-containing protein [Mariniblastus fucicola]QEG24665.1 PRC-barrel domain protein [Mariniblastus fucicola]